MNELGDPIETVEGQRKTLEIRTDDDAVFETLRRHFETRNVDVRRQSLGSLDGAGFVIIRSADDTFRGALGLDQFAAILSPRTHPPWELAETDDDRAELFSFLEETLFTSYSRRQMLATSREIEDRAWRVGAGRLYAGFERAPALAAQTDVYERFGRHDSLTVAVFIDEWTEPVPGGVAVVSERGSELGDYWFVVFDGGDNDQEACALLAEERHPGSFYGFWTYDPELVAELVTYLETTYDVPAPS